MIISALVVSHYIPIKSFTYQTDTTCRPNLFLGNGAVHEINKYKVIKGGLSEFNNSKTELINQKINQQHVPGCEYSTSTIYLYIF